MKVKQGDIVLVHSKTLLGRIIQFGMNVERWRWFSFHPFWKKVCNHAAICYEDGFIAEALACGITTHSIDEAYGNFKNGTIWIYRPKWNKLEKDRIKVHALRYRKVYYQFINFLQYIPKILFGMWLGKTGKAAEDRLYCTEYVALVINKATLGKLFKKYWRTSPSGVQSWCEKNAELVGEYEF